MPELATIENIASDTPSRTVTLSGISVTVLLSCLDGAGRWFDWFDDGKQVTYPQYVQILEYLAQARYELMLSQIGEVKMTASAIIPDGCLLCDGATYEKASYPDLYAVLASEFIIDDTHFRTPDLRERFVMGASDTSPIGATGGATTITLTVDQIPSHHHTIPFTATTLAVEPGEVTVLTPVPILTQDTGDTGGDGSHNNIPPFCAIAYYIVAS